MRMIVASAILAMALVAVPSSQTSRDTRSSDSLERAFTSNGRITFSLSAGEYRITGSADNRLRLKWRVRDPDDLPRVFAAADVRGREANITTEGPNNFKADIQVPARSDLYVRLTAGGADDRGDHGQQGRLAARRRAANRRGPPPGLSLGRGIGVGRRGARHSLQDIQGRPVPVVQLDG